MKQHTCRQRTIHCEHQPWENRYLYGQTTKLSMQTWSQESGSLLGVNPAIYKRQITTITIAIRGGRAEISPLKQRQSTSISWSGGRRANSVGGAACKRVAGQMTSLEFRIVSIWQLHPHQGGILPNGNQPKQHQVQPRRELPNRKAAKSRKVWTGSKDSLEENTVLIDHLLSRCNYLLWTSKTFL